ncbi:hypothetical protein DFQ28_005906 [Apophysomyces sp. BC1034]|nr:hypothetical protein DFQ30_005391 [Apophysomyces sp. BC1015]KAG0177476.1 hypothetical protein DFQ29_004775 [Apophysomyces sp. BC1021]KAG0187736.1 hypothetical protein DFQ28_005906 [Apophysomyces sp. BC1034]
MLSFVRPRLLVRQVRCYSNDTLIEFKHANVHRFGATKPAFKNLSLAIRRNQRVVIVGPVSAGKSTLAEALAGQHVIQPAGAAKWPACTSSYPSDFVHLVSFREQSKLFSYGQHYYQERFNFSDPDNDLTLKDYLQGEQVNDPSKILKVAEQLDISHLLPLSFVKLSNGQTRRARLARALLRNPGMLILDEPLMGLDVEHRQKLLQLLGELATTGPPVVLVLRPQDEFPLWATDVVVLKDMAIAGIESPETHIASRKEALRRQKEEDDAASLSKQQQTAKNPNAAAAIVDLKSVNVVYGGNKILDNVSWTVRQGERWALLGPNGCGKTTLLSLLTGDHPQAYANELYLFGRRRGTGESIWQIKERVGLVSPEIHLYFNQSLTGLEAAGTGFFDVVVPRRLSDEQVQTVQRLFGEFGLESFADRKLSDMSTGEQRLVLLVRSLVKMPDLVVWDEPFQGLDDKMIKNVNRWLEDHMRPEQTLIMVTHHEEEIPRAITKRFKLAAGGKHGNNL